MEKVDAALLSALGKSSDPRDRLILYLVARLEEVDRRLTLATGRLGESQASIRTCLDWDAAAIAGLSFAVAELQPVQC